MPDAAIIADQARMRRDLQPLRAGDEIAVDLRILTARRTDLLFGIFFGYPDLDHPAATYDNGRIAASQSVFRHSSYDQDARTTDDRRSHLDAIRNTGTADSVR